jgi:hypothetical protein
MPDGRAVWYNVYLLQPDSSPGPLTGNRGVNDRDSPQPIHPVGGPGTWKSLGPNSMVRRLASGRALVTKGERCNGRALRQFSPDGSLVWAVVGFFTSRLAARTGRSAQSGGRDPSL